ncbi:MAG: hypothetical protein V4864_12425 [Pseudomonadota bacterium]
MNRFMTNTTPRLAAALNIPRQAVALGAALLSLSAFAQSPAKTVVAEPVAVLPSFGQWVASFAAPLPETPIDAGTLRIVQANAGVPMQPVLYEPKPVVLGQPELPLLGEAGAAVARGWSPAFNYQGMHVKLVVLDAQGMVRQVRPLNAPLRPGERFKIRVTPTFEAVASVDRLVGTAFALQRAGQFYPAAGSSVQINPGETADLPLGANEYFVMGTGAERMVLSVRHPRASGGAASDQAAYREDGARGSNYLQLVPFGRLPALEQQLGVAGAL